jgi:hypothetical protein
MTPKQFVYLLLIIVLIISGCIKETYNMNKLSNKINYSPSLSIVAANGNISLSDIVKPNDTVRFDGTKFVNIVLKKDSVINMKLADYFDLSNMVSFSKGYKLGNLKLDPFSSSISIPLSSFSSSITPSPVNGLFIFPPFGTINLPNTAFNGINNFQNAVFFSGTITISVTNNLPVTLDSIKISLFNSVGPTPIGGKVTIPPITAGGTKTATIDLAGKTVTNSIYAAIILTGSPGSGSPVFINLSKTIDVGISATNLQVQSGSVILSSQPITSLSGVDIVSFNPGNNVKIERLKVLTGNISYTLASSIKINGTFSFSLPTAKKNNVPISASIQLKGSSNQTFYPGSISVDNTDVDLSTDVNQNFNRIPIKDSLNVNSNNTWINFNSNDSVHINVSMLNPNFDFVKGDFGQLSEQFNPQNLDMGLDQILNHITGLFHITNPSIKFTYSNSFGIPIGVTLNASGQRNSQIVNLALNPNPFTIAYPKTTRDTTSSITIDSTNSALPNLLSLPPSKVTFSGSGKMNPGPPAGGNTNYVFGNSRFLGSVEVDVPLQLWMKNLQFSDTLDNFLKLKSTDNTSFIDSLQINIAANNGFPLGASLKVILYDSGNKNNPNLKTIDATDLIKPAPVDANGKSSGKTASSITIDFPRDFFTAVNSANKIIFMFTLNTTGNGANNVKIYSDYSISFTVSLAGKANINQ